MFFKRNDQRRSHPYLALTVGTLTVVGAATVMKCVKNAMRYSRDKVTCVFKGVMGSSSDDTCGE